VVTRLEYDHDSLKPGQRKAQDANSVFVNRIGVCEGYARLMVELGKQTGDQIIYLGGDVREENGSAAPIGHAWNAVEIDRHWYLVDATWDDPTMNGHSRSYRTDYLFIPPNVAIWSHFPDDARWQLLDKPLSRGDFLRQPFARPGIAREGLTLTSPNRAAVDSADSLDVVLENPLHRYLMIKYRTASGKELDCANTNAERVSSKCPVPESGEAIIFSNDEQYGEYSQVVRIAVTRR
jgi:transglutaminase/protease-like cytokinesis protein 3